ncbi:uncharacterized protein LOC123322272 [Coccinella septempunctata]|uniref:uncharacterized protein LOC123322272 n=1 Tax=Coccinella septempunctata TaxID=41139 RepID=UPI001D06E781|nr:uncharacterized protein LOC123322272 [Coccinella septempunctata]
MKRILDIHCTVTPCINNKINMFKLIAFFALLVCALAAPKPKPQLPIISDYIPLSYSSINPINPIYNNLGYNNLGYSYGYAPYAPNFYYNNGFNNLGYGYGLYL